MGLFCAGNSFTKLKRMYFHCFPLIEKREEQKYHIKWRYAYLVHCWHMHTFTARACASLWSDKAARVRAEYFRALWCHQWLRQAAIHCPTIDPIYSENTLNLSYILDSFSWMPNGLSSFRRKLLKIVQESFRLKKNTSNFLRNQYLNTRCKQRVRESTWTLHRSNRICIWYFDSCFVLTSEQRVAKRVSSLFSLLEGEQN